MKRLLLFISVFSLTLALSGCKEEPEIKTMQDVDLNDIVEMKMEVIWQYTGDDFEDGFTETYYYDLIEEFNYLEYSNYYYGGNSFRYIMETINGNVYAYEFEDGDAWQMETPSRHRIDLLTSSDDLDIYLAFDEYFELVEPTDKDGLDYYQKSSVVNDVTPELKKYIQSLTTEDNYTETVGVEMYCHKTSEYCDYRLQLDFIAEDNLRSSIENPQLRIDFVHTFYTQDSLRKEDVFPSVFHEDDYPNTYSSLQLSSNRVFGTNLTGIIDFEWDGDVYEFKVLEDGLYTPVLSTPENPTELLFLQIMDQELNLLFEGEITSETILEEIGLYMDQTYIVSVSTYDISTIGLQFAVQFIEYTE